MSSSSPSFEVPEFSSSEDTESEEEPWRVRPEWQTNKFIDDKKPGWIKLIIGGFLGIQLVPVGAVMMIGGVLSLFTASDPQWESLFFGVLALAIGVPLLWFLVAAPYLRYRKFGTTVLVMEEMPGCLGNRLQMRLQTGIDPDKRPNDGLWVELKAIRREVYEEESIGDEDDEIEIEKHVLWKDDVNVTEHRRSDDGRLEYQLSFDLPEDVPPSTPEKKRNRIMWVLEAVGEVEGLDYASSFEIPVFEPADVHFSE